MFKTWEHASRVMEEFFLQGDKEREEGLAVSPMFDRSKADINKAQLGFIDFIVSPLYENIIKVFPTLHICGKNLVANRGTYTQKCVECLESDRCTSKLESKRQELEKKQETFEDRFNRLGHRVLSRNASTVEFRINLLRQSNTPPTIEVDE